MVDFSECDQCLRCVWLGHGWTNSYWTPAENCTWRLFYTFQYFRNAMSHSALQNNTQQQVNPVSPHMKYMTKNVSKERKNVLKTYPTSTWWWDWYWYFDTFYLQSCSGFFCLLLFFFNLKGCCSTSNQPHACYSQLCVSVELVDHFVIEICCFQNYVRKGWFCDFYTWMAILGLFRVLTNRFIRLVVGRPTGRYVM